MQLNLHSPLTSSASSSSEVLTTATKINTNRRKRHYSFSHPTTSNGNRSRNHNTSDPENMVRRLGTLNACSNLQSRKTIDLGYFGFRIRNIIVYCSNNYILDKKMKRF